jgi:hypothetical protein
MKRATLLAAVALFALAACDDKKSESKTEDPSTKNATTAASTTANAAAAGTATAATPAAVSINDNDLATPADFEESAEKAITKANYKQELSTLEGDINKE